MIAVFVLALAQAASTPQPRQDSAQVGTSQELQVDVRQKTAEVRVTVRGAKEKGAEVVRVLQWSLEAREGIFEGGWADVSIASPSVERGGLTAELTLAGAGLYEIVLGSSSVKVAVSRTDLKGWKDDLKALRESVRRLEQIAAVIDQVKDPSADQVAQIRLRLQQERGRLSKIRTELKASLKALEVEVDRLYYSRPLLGLPPAPAGEAVPGYGSQPQAKDRDAARWSGVAEVQALREWINREGVLLLLEELRLLLAPDDRSLGAQRVLRWRDRARALDALQDARQALGEYPELEKVLKDAQSGQDGEELWERVSILKGKVCKP